MNRGKADNKESEELYNQLTRAGLDAQVFASQMAVVISDSPKAAKQLIEGEMSPDSLVKKTDEMYEVEEPNISFELRHEIAQEAVRTAKDNLQS